MHPFILDDEDLEDAVSLAEKSVAHYEKRFGAKGSGTYRHNKIEGCLVGFKCEYGVFKYIEKHTSREVTPCFDVLNSNIDMLVDDFKIGVKGLRNEHWEKFKRCIPPKQLEKYVRDEIVVVWATTLPDKVSSEVRVHGWNYAQDLKDKGLFRRTICDNIGLPDDDDMRSLKDLKKLLK